MSLAQSSSLTGGSVWHPTMEASCWRMEDSGACFSWMGDVPRHTAGGRPAEGWT